MSPITPDIPTSSAGASTEDLYARLCDLIGEEVSDMYSQSEKIAALNEGKDDLFAEIDVMLKTYTGATVAGTATVTAPSDLARWSWLKLGTEQLTPITAVEVPPALFVASGTPTHFSAEFLNAAGDWLITLYPTPSAVGVLTGAYYAVPPDLAMDASGNGTAEPTWHVKWRPLICYYAAGVLLHKDNLPEEAEMFMSKYLDGKDAYRRWFNARLPQRSAVTAAVVVEDM